LIIVSTATCESHGAQSTRTDTASYRLGPIQHETLTAAQFERIRELRQTFRDVDSSSLEKWIDDFRRDADPDREIVIWERMAQAYRTYSSHRPLSRAAKADLFGVLLMRSSGSDSFVLSNMRLSVLTPADARDILRLYQAAPAPIQVTDSPRH
jgi:hypothetical protein